MGSVVKKVVKAVVKLVKAIVKAVVYVVKAVGGLVKGVFKGDLASIFTVVMTVITFGMYGLIAAIAYFLVSACLSKAQADKAEKMKEEAEKDLLAQADLQTAEGQRELNEHFDRMEEDRFNQYEGNVIGSTPILTDDSSFDISDGSLANDNEDFEKDNGLWIPLLGALTIGSLYLGGA